MLSDYNYIIISISDIHFGAMDSQYMYNILLDQFINKISKLNFNILAICGDLFDSKYMSNNPIISYVLTFIDNLVQLCRSKNAALILLDGTQSHDNGQLKLFYHYLNDPSIDMYIIEQIQFICVKNLRILCIPEKYNISEDEYKNVLFNSGMYDMCLLHGTYNGSFKGSEIPTLNDRVPIFSMDSFSNCVGPILMGHYHISGCYDKYAYYNGSPLRWKFGEENKKGFLITLYNSYNRWHYTELVPIISKSYITININDLLNNDPSEIIEYIKNYKLSHNIDYIRIQFNSPNENINLVRSYFRTDQTVILQELNREQKAIEEINQNIQEQQSQYSYITDSNINEYTKFVMYMNQCENNSDFITVDELMSLLS